MGWNGNGRSNQHSDHIQSGRGREDDGPEARPGAGQRGAFHFSWRPGIATLRLMAQREDFSTALVHLADNLSAVRQLGHEAAARLLQEREAYLTALRLGGQPSRMLARPEVISLYTERWVGTQTEGSWEPLGAREGGFYRMFRPLPLSADADRLQAELFSADRATARHALKSPGRNFRK